LLRKFCCIPPSTDLHHAISQVEGENSAPIERATAVIDANEAAANDIEEEEYLPADPKDDDDDENPEVEEEGASEDGEEEPVAEMGVTEEGNEQRPVETIPDGEEVPATEMGVDEEGNEQRPVGTVQEPPAEDSATYGGRKQATIHRIQALLGEKVLIRKAEVSSWNGQLLKSRTL